MTMSGMQTVQPIRFSLLYQSDAMQWTCDGPVVEITGGGRKHRLTLARASLIAAGFTTPDQAGESLEQRLPRQPRHAVPADKAYEPTVRRNGSAQRYQLLAALILGRCVDGVFDPERPHIWSEKRLSQRVVLFRPRGFYDQ